METKVQKAKKIRIGMALSLWAVTSHTGWAQDHFSKLDGVQISEPSTHMEWLFNMGLVSGQNERGESRHFALIINTLIAPQVKMLGPLPYLDFKAKPTVLVTVHDLDRKEVMQEQIQMDALDRATFSVNSADGKVRVLRVDSLAGIVTRMQVDTGKLGISVQVVSTKPQALFGNQGWADNGTLGKALYLSRTGRALDSSYSSILRIKGETVRLSEGQFWEDHQSVDALHLDIIKLKWNWFALHFSDHSEAMIYRIEDRKTGKLFNLFAQRVLPDGSIENLENVQISETAHEISRGHTVPTEWDILVPGKAAIHLEHVIHAPWYDVSLGLLHDSALEGSCYVKGSTIWGEVTLAWAEYTSAGFFGIGR